MHHLVDDLPARRISIDKPATVPNIARAKHWYSPSSPTPGDKIVNVPLAASTFIPSSEIINGAPSLVHEKLQTHIMYIIVFYTSMSNLNLDQIKSINSNCTVTRAYPGFVFGARGAGFRFTDCTYLKTRPLLYFQITSANIGQYQLFLVDKIYKVSNVHIYCLRIL